MKLEIDSIQRAEKFIPDFLETGKAYALINPNGGLCSWPSNDYENTDVIPIWSNHFLAYARAFGEGAELHEMSIDETLALLNDLIKDDVMIGLNWDNQGYGQEVEPAEIFNPILAHIEPLAEERASTFIPDLLAVGHVYFENDPERGLITWPRFEFMNERTQLPIPIVPVWSNQFAETARTFATLAPIQQIDLDEFCSSFLPYAIENGMLIGINWDQHGYGRVFDPKVLLAALEKQL